MTNDESINKKRIIYSVNKKKWKKEMEIEQ